MLKWFVKENDWLYKKIPEEIKQNFPEIYNIGWGNGYVLIPQNHTLYGIPHDEIDVNAPGGLTYGTIINKKHLKIFNLDKSDIGMYCLGFDTAHYDDSIEKWPKEEVEKATKKLAEDLELIDILNKNNA